MTKGQGLSRINAIQIGEFTAELISFQSLSAKYAFANAETGERFGAGNRNQWSPETLTRLAALIESMERDVCNEVFAGGTTTPSDTLSTDTTSDEIPSL